MRFFRGQFEVSLDQLVVSFRYVSVWSFVCQSEVDLFYIIQQDFPKAVLGLMH